MKHKHRQHKWYNSRKEWMQAEFNFSDEEVEGLDKFLSGRDSGLVSEFLRSVISTDDLNNRQKVIISFMMGKFVQETFMMGKFIQETFMMGKFVQETVQEQLRPIEKSIGG